MLTDQDKKAIKKQIDEEAIKDITNIMNKAIHEAFDISKITECILNEMQKVFEKGMQTGFGIAIKYGDRISKIEDLTGR